MISKYSLIIMLGLLLVIAGCTSEEAVNYEIVGDSVQVNDSNIFMSATPHTLRHSDWVEVEFESKLFSGEIDVAFGFDTTDAKPLEVQRWNPHEETIIYTCNGEFNYTTNPNFFWCYEDGIQVEHGPFDGGNLQEKTAWWNVSKNWTDFSGSFDSIDFEFDDKNKWYYRQGQNINAGQTYKIRYFLEVNPGASNVKYDIAIKPSSETIQEAIQNNHFYYLDPWADYNLDSGLLAYYTFDDDDHSDNNVRDMTDQGRNGTNSGATTGGAGILGESFDIDSATDTVTVPDDTYIDLPDGGTINMWVDLTNIANGGRLWEKNDGGAPIGNNGYSLYFDGATNFLQLFIDGNDRATSNNNVNGPGWTMVTVILNEGSNSEIYLNGTDATATQASQVAMPGGTDPIRIGNRQQLDRFLNGNVDEFAIWNRSLTSTEIGYLWNGGLGLEYASQSENSTNISQHTIAPTELYAATGSLNCSAQINTTSGGDFNASINWSNATYSEKTNFTDYTNTSWISANITFGAPFLPVLGETWNCSIYAYDTLNITRNQSSSVVEVVLDTTPSWTLNESNKTIDHTSNLSLDFDCVDPDGPVTYSIANYTPNLQTPLTINSTGALVTNPSYQDAENFGGSYDYNVTCSQGGADTNSLFNLTINQNIYFNQNTTKQNVTVAGSTTFNLDFNITNFTTSPGIPILYFNGSTYEATNDGSGTVGDMKYYNYSYTLQTQLGMGNTTGVRQPYNWSFNISDVNNMNAFNTSESNLTVFEVAIDNCSVYTDTILNFTLVHEGNNTIFDGVTTPKSIGVDVNLTSYENTSIVYGFSQVFENANNATVCVPGSAINGNNFRIESEAEYVADNHVTEFWYLDNGNLSSLDSFNTFTNKNILLRDLATADSTTFLVNYFNEQGVQEDDIIIVTYKKYIGEGIFREVERSRENPTEPSPIHLVEEDAIYYFLVTQNSTILFTSSELQAVCQAVPCTVNLEASTDFTEFDKDWDLVPDGQYSIGASAVSREVTLTFSASNSSNWTLRLYKFSSNPANATIVNTTSLTSSTGTITTSAPQTAGNVTFVARVYRDGGFIKDTIVDFKTDISDLFTTAGGLIMGALIILTLILMTATEGPAMFIFAILGFVLVSVLGILKFNWAAFISLLILVILIIYKVTRGER